MKVRVVEEFRVVGPVDPETGRPVPDRVLTVGFEGEVINHGVAGGLLGVEDGTEIYVVKAPTSLSPSERAIMGVIAAGFPEAREHMDEGVSIDYVPASHVEVVADQPSARAEPIVIEGTVELPDDQPDISGDPEIVSEGLDMSPVVERRLFRGPSCPTHGESLVMVWRCEEPANMNGAPRQVCPECLEERAEKAERERDEANKAADITRSRIDESVWKKMRAERDEAIRRLKEKGESDGGMAGR